MDPLHIIADQAATIKSLCDRLDAIHELADDGRRHTGQPWTAHKALEKIQRISAGFAQIPPAACCGERHTETEAHCPKEI